MSSMITSKTEIKKKKKNCQFCATDCSVLEGKINVSLPSDAINRSIKVKLSFDSWSSQKQEQDMII